MPLTLDQATYHLGYEANGEQPVISLCFQEIQCHKRGSKLLSYS